LFSKATSCCLFIYHPLGRKNIPVCRRIFAVMTVPMKCVIEQLKKNLSPELYLHCSGVADTAVSLAAMLDCNQEKARQAGWLHDCAREWSAEKLKNFARQNGIDADPFSQRHPILLHAPVSAAQAHAMGISDSEVLSAIRNHTLGYRGMSILEQIIYVADKIEPGRNYPGVDELRQTVRNDFHQGLLLVASQSITYVLSKNQPIHPLTVSFWNWLTE
jgi:predicted HD superfamily hydrolase involved in NAD metabolism